MEWLQLKMEARSLSQTDLALEIEQNPSVISRWYRGLQKPSLANARRLADYFGVSRDEVLGMVYNDGGQPDLPDQPRSLREQALEFLSELPVAIPIHDQAASAGFGQSLLEYAYWSPPRAAGRNIVGMQVHGNSMEPEILDGDIVFIDRDGEIEVGKTVVATVGDQVLVKKLRRRAGKLVLVGRNGEVSADNAKFEGVVVGFQRLL